MIKQTSWIYAYILLKLYRSNQVREYLCFSENQGWDYKEGKRSIFLRGGNKKELHGIEVIFLASVAFFFTLF